MTGCTFRFHVMILDDQTVLHIEKERWCCCSSDANDASHSRLKKRVDTVTRAMKRSGAQIKIPSYNLVILPDYNRFYKLISPPIERIK